MTPEQGSAVATCLKLGSHRMHRWPWLKPREQMFKSLGNARIKAAFKAQTVHVLGTGAGLPLDGTGNVGTTMCPFRVPVPSIQPWEVWQESKLEENLFLGPAG